jgi:outer membrane protein insertion porin family
MVNHLKLRPPHSLFKSFLVLMAFTVIIWSNPLSARTLDLSSLAPKTQENLKSQFPKVIDGTFKKDDLDQILRYLVSQELYDSVEVRSEKNSDDFKILVGKTKRISQVIFSGNDVISESVLRREFAITSKSAFDQQVLIEAGERLRKLYIERAFNNVVVDLEFHNIGPQDIEVRVIIKEGLQTLIKTVDIKCGNPSLQRELEKLIRKRLKEPLTDGTLSEIRKAVRERLSDEMYLTAELIGPQVTMNADESEAQLYFTVERPIQYKLDFRGNSKFSNRTLEGSLDLVNFHSSNPNIAPELGTKIKNFYLSEGFARVEVQGEEILSDKKFQTTLVIQVTEGPLVKIKSIEFTGRYSQPDTTYRKILNENASPLFKKMIYNREDLESAFKNLKIERQNQGYFKAKVVSSRTTYNKERDQVTITVNFDEGPLTIVQKVGFEGNTSYSSEQLTALLGLEINRPLKLKALDEAILKVKNHYHDSGFLEMTLLNENEDLVTYNEDNTLASLNFKIYEGPQIIVGSILIEGATITKEFVILKELEFKVGDILTPQNLDESIGRLQRVGHFNSVDIRTLEEKTQVSRRTVVVRVSDRDPGLFNMGAGVTNERNLTLRGFLGVAYRNIGGTGREASARFDANYNIADVKYLESKTSLFYSEPYLFQTRNRGTVNFVESKAVNPTISTQGVQLRQVNFTVAQNITSHVLVSWDLWNKATYRDFYLDSNVDKNRVEIASVGPTLDLDYRDHPFNPSRGTFTRLNIEYASPGLGSSHTIEYARSNLGFTLYTPLSNTGTWVWANSWRGSYMQNLSTLAEGGVPWDKKGLILGGQDTIRGFAYGEAFPNDSDFKIATGTLQEPYLLKGWASSFLIKSEIRFPIYGNFGGAVFYDGGAVKVGGVTFDDYYRDSVGIAFRYATPIGAVSLGWGYKLDRQSDRNESQFPFHFSIGTF